MHTISHNHRDLFFLNNRKQNSYEKASHYYDLHNHIVYSIVVEMGFHTLYCQSSTTFAFQLILFVKEQCLVYGWSGENIIFLCRRKPVSELAF